MQRCSTSAGITLDDISEIVGATLVKAFDPLQEPEMEDDVTPKRMRLGLEPRMMLLQRSYSAGCLSRSPSNSSDSMGATSPSRRSLPGASPSRWPRSPGSASPSGRPPPSSPGGASPSRLKRQRSRGVPPPMQRIVRDAVAMERRLAVEAGGVGSPAHTLLRSPSRRLDADKCEMHESEKDPSVFGRSPGGKSAPSLPKKSPSRFSVGTLTSRCSSVGTMTTVWTDATELNRRSVDKAMGKALVINFRRLISLKEKMDIIHEVIKATTIAVLTLLIVRVGRELVHDVGFVVLSLMLYGCHEMSYDSLDVGDLTSLISLLGNDGDPLLLQSPTMVPLQNPNRCLQAMNYSARHRRRAASSLVSFVCFALHTAGWVASVWNWTTGTETYIWYNAIGIDAEPLEGEAMHYNTLRLIGTVMVLCHLVFEFCKWREFQFTAPLSKDGSPWDVTRDGIPPGRLNRIFGLPSIWFSSPTAYQDLRTWVTLACQHTVGQKEDRSHDRPVRAHRQIFAEELAFFAIKDPYNAAHVRQCLLTSKIYDKRNRHFLKRPLDGEVNVHRRPGVRVTGLRYFGHEEDEEFFQANLRKGEPPTELGVDLLFYDSRTHEISAPKLPEELEEDRAKTLRHASSGGLSPTISCNSMRAASSRA